MSLSVPKRNPNLMYYESVIVTGASVKASAYDTRQSGLNGTRGVFESSSGPGRSAPRGGLRKTMPLPSQVSQRQAFAMRVAEEKTGISPLRMMRQAPRQTWHRSSYIDLTHPVWFSRGSPR
jgi:hypothetical protein